MGEIDRLSNASTHFVGDVPRLGSEKLLKQGFGMVEDRLMKILASDVKGFVSLEPLRGRFLMAH
jgi:hypothetical protein